jgi:hypothetical protein
VPRLTGSEANPILVGIHGALARPPEGQKQIATSRNGPRNVR